MQHHRISPLKNFHVSNSSVCDMGMDPIGPMPVWSSTRASGNGLGDGKDIESRGISGRAYLIVTPSSNALPVLVFPAGSKRQVA
jgi:hypothetical protein